MGSITIAGHRMPPMTFDGEELCRLSTRRDAEMYWTEYALYRTRGGHYVYDCIAATAKASGYENHFPVRLQTTADLYRHAPRGIASQLLEMAGVDSITID